MIEALKTDVVVVGAGNAALVAALSAHEAGAKVIVVEAAPIEERGGNSVFTGGYFRCPYPDKDTVSTVLTEESKEWLDRVDIIPYSEEEFEADLINTSAGRCDRDLVRTYVSQAFDAVVWMHERGVAFELALGKVHDPREMAKSDRYVLARGAALRSQGEGVGLMENLFDAVEAAGIEVLYNTPAEEILRDGTRVVGVRVARDGEWQEVYGTVILASGGFGANSEMRQRYLGPGWDLVKIRGSRFSTGRMLSEALSMGAQPAGHWGGCHASALDGDAPAIGEIALTDKMSRYSYPYSIMVNQDGERFVDEGADELWMTYASTGSAIRSQPNALAYQLFDQKTIHLLEPRYELAHPVEAHSIEELAALLGIEEARLVETVREYNAATQAGRFMPFVKDGLRTVETYRPAKSNWALPLDEPPYRAYKVTCGLTFTYGGVKIDRESRVIDLEGNVIRNLYATGEVIGGVFYHNYPAGSGLTMGSVFGRIAGEGAARESIGVA